jgi:hypothetical protein
MLAHIRGEIMAERRGDVKRGRSWGKITAENAKGTKKKH